MANYNCSQLAQLWVQAGGPSAVANLMASVAMAESNGNPSAVNNQSGATGLWQILPLPGRPGGMTDPTANAKEAVSIYNSQGLGAWEASRAAGSGGGWGVNPACGSSGGPSAGAAQAMGATTPTASIQSGLTSQSGCAYPVLKGGFLGQSGICADGVIGMLAAALGAVVVLVALAVLTGFGSAAAGTAIGAGRLAVLRGI